MEQIHATFRSFRRLFLIHCRTLQYLIYGIPFFTLSVWMQTNENQIPENDSAVHSAKNKLIVISTFMITTVIVTVLALSSLQLELKQDFVLALNQVVFLNKKKLILHLEMHLLKQHLVKNAEIIVNLLFGLVVMLHPCSLLYLECLCFIQLTQFTT